MVWGQNYACMYGLGPKLCMHGLGPKLSMHGLGPKLSMHGLGPKVFANYTPVHCRTLCQRQILRLVQIESICRRQNKCISEKQKFFLGWVENIVGEGEIACHEQFLLFPQCFQKASFLGELTVGIVWLRDNEYGFYGSIIR